MTNVEGMGVRLRIDDLSLDDVDEVQTLVSTSFDPLLRPYMTSVQSGAGRFLEAFVRHPALTPDRRYRVARSNHGLLLGYADLRLTGGASSFLSNIAIAPEARGQGIASAILDDFLTTHPTVASMELDVFSDNIPARSLYEKRGFNSVRSVDWWVRKPPAPRQFPEGWTLSNPENAAAWQQTFGFCEYALDTGTSVRRFGQIGPGTLRCFSVEDFQDDDFLASAAKLVPGIQNVFYIGPSEAGPPSNDSESINTSLRMLGHSVTSVSS